MAVRIGSLVMPVLLAAGAFRSAGPTAAPPALAEIEIAAGPTARHNTPVSFALPGASAGARYALEGREGSTLPLQIDDGSAWVVVPRLAAGASATFRIVETGADHLVEVAAQRAGDDVRFAARGRPVLVYVGGAGKLPDGGIAPIFRRGGYLHPVRTPSGRIVTGDYPPDHRHHHGVWLSWTRTRFQGREPDFWNMGDGKGRVEVEALDRMWSGPVHAGLVAQHRYVDLTSGAEVTVLREQWLTRVFDLAPGTEQFVFDVEVRQTNVAGTPLYLPEYHYGGMAVRGAADFVPLDNAVFLTSEGNDRKSGDAAPSRWAYVAGTVDGARAGIAILAHSTNFRAPEPMRIHPTNPYMCYAPSKAGNWEIPPGGGYSARYRFVAFDGTPSPADLERLWRDYVEPPTVRARTGAQSGGLR